MPDHVDLYMIAFVEGDKAAMQREMAWAKGRSDEFFMLETVAEVAAATGRLQQSRDFYRQAVESAQRAKQPESVAGIQAHLARREAEVGNAAQAREAVRTR